MTGFPVVKMPRIRLPRTASSALPFPSFLLLPVKLSVLLLLLLCERKRPPLEESSGRGRGRRRIPPKPKTKTKQQALSFSNVQSSFSAFHPKRTGSLNYTFRLWVATQVGRSLVVGNEIHHVHLLTVSLSPYCSRLQKRIGVTQFSRL